MMATISPEAARGLCYALDPALFAQSLGFTPDDWQADVLRSKDNMLLNVHRQGGKSTTVAVKALHKAVYTPGLLILTLSPSLRQSSELFRKVRGFYDAMPPEIKPGLDELKLGPVQPIDISIPMPKQPAPEQKQ